MYIISAAELDFFGDSDRPAAVCDGATFEFIGLTETKVTRRQVRFQGKQYEIGKVGSGSTSSAWAVLHETPEVSNA